MWDQAESLSWKGCLWGSSGWRGGRARDQGGVSLLERMLWRLKESELAGERLSKSFF